MNSFQRALIASCIALAGSGIARAQHFDVLVQQRAGHLVTGTADFDNNQWTLGRRVWSRDFGTSYAINGPGFNALGSGSPSLPAGSQALPGNAPLSWDFLPMTIDATSQNLFYWNGLESNGMPGLTPEDVAFGPLPGPNYLLSLFDKSNVKHSVNGANAVMPGGIIENTAADGALHRHRFFLLEDGDGNGATTPADGIYLLAMRLKMTELENSLPMFMVFGTPGSSVAALDDAAVPWVEQQLNLPGDYNQNGVVDAADYVLWRAANGQFDYDLWRQNFGRASQLIVNVGSGAGSSGSLQSADVPEPHLAQLLLAATIALAIMRGHRRGKRTYPRNYNRFNRPAAKPAFL